MEERGRGKGGGEAQIKRSKVGQKWMVTGGRGSTEIGFPQL